MTYETPGGKLTAREIAQTSIVFTGTLTAIDLGEKTLKARAVFDTKKFNVADNCAIVINGKTDGQLSDLKPDDKLVFSYDEINGVNVVNRIAPAEAQANSVATGSAEPMRPPMSRILMSVASGGGHSIKARWFRPPLFPGVPPGGFAAPVVSTALTAV